MTITTIMPARGQAQLVADHLRVVRGGRTILDDVSMAVAPGARWGIVGENGCGKSTLLAALSGGLTPESGTVHRFGSLGLVEQELSAAGGITVGDVIEVELAAVRRVLAAFESASAALANGETAAAGAYADALAAAEALDAWDADRRVDVALAGLNAVTDRTRRLAELSVGQRYRVRLACVLGAGHDFLLLDEPTNHLDAGGLEFLTARLRGHPGGVVVVSHDRALLSDVATSILDLDRSRDGRPRVYGDGFAGYQHGRRAELARWEEEFEQQQIERTRLTRQLSEAQNRLVSGWRPDKGTGKHQRATRAPALVRAVHRRRDELDQHAVDAPPPPLRFRMPDLPARPGVALLTAHRVAVPGRLAGPVSLALVSGARLVVTGANGAGKSTLLSALAGRLPVAEGSVTRAPSTRVELLGQESDEPSRAGAVDWFAAQLRRLVRARLLDDGEIVALSSLGLLTAADARRPVAELSVGQQRRLDLAVALAARPHVLLLDEPTNHFSIALVEELAEGLRSTPAAVVVATHDRQLLRDLDAWPRLHLGDEPG
ncbi:macrolide transport system ATP-binding/permease protein [Micromonospora echinaurantiaca]|uniref:Macrolide transport system ATP-binding/permease protein n=1 Tax=Micromonospora echinaurantiaca TaxID=47857 RepID=A0A1C5HJE6_9ACTN|nr:ABC-F family ATP-binding cassette domain-containing protein [Micromonospora echinaurantiaca]SCG45631.1 macrolide transport system ATP-binding/permease protein [Micromonospora echinaurantiaca]